MYVINDSDTLGLQCFNANSMNYLFPNVESDGIIVSFRTTGLYHFM